MLVTVAMIKPDGVARTEVSTAVVRGLAGRGLTVSHDSEMRLTEADVAALFPAFRNCPITLYLLATYLTSGPVRMLVVEGAQVIDHARAVRAEIRARYAVSSFANCLHVAADVDEAVLQLRWLAAREGWPPPSLPDDPAQEPRSIPGVTGTMARLGAATLREIAIRVWRTASRSGWSGHWRLAPGDGESTLVIDSEERNSIDSAASHLLEVVPGLTAETAVYAALEIDRAGSAALFRGPRREVGTLAEELCRRGLVARLVEGSQLEKSGSSANG